MRRMAAVVGVCAAVLMVAGCSSSSPPSTPVQPGADTRTSAVPLDSQDTFTKADAIHALEADMAQYSDTEMKTMCTVLSGDPAKVRAAMTQVIGGMYDKVMADAAANGLTVDPGITEEFFVDQEMILIEERCA